jgi:hypothetical protein
MRIITNAAQPQENQMDITAVVIVRKRGAIGVFEPHEFTISVDSGLPTWGRVFDAFLTQYGDQWEPHHLVYYTAGAERVNVSPMIRYGTDCI